MRKTLLILLAVIVVGAGAFVGLRYWVDHRVAVSSGSIPASGGAELSATVIKPTGSGTHPLIVMPTAWGSRQSEYLAVGRLFAKHGFLVVAYTQRGFNASTGQIDFAGPTTVADASAVIDWAIKHKSADASQVGMLGQSYGGGVSLLAAEHDPRIKAVVALSTWTSWGGTFIENGTLVSRSLKSLLVDGPSNTRHLDSQISTLALEFPTDPAAAMTLINKLSPERSPIDGVAALNKNKTAVMLANGFQDQLLNPQQVVDLYGKLTGPKRLQLGTGDHGQVEAHALASGTATGPIANALKWMQHYVQGHDNGIQSLAPIQVVDSKTGVTRNLTSWPALTSKEQTTLPAPVGTKNYATATGSWTVLLGAGRGTVAAAPTEQSPLTSSYRFVPVNLALNNPKVGLRWDGPKQTAPLTVQGSGRLTFGLTDNIDPAASVFAYLYDVNSAGVGTLMSVTPLSVSGLTEKTPKYVSVSLTPAAWTVPAGDHVSLVLGAEDAKWTSVGRAGAVLGVLSTPSQPATLTLPTT